VECVLHIRSGRKDRRSHAYPARTMISDQHWAKIKHVLHRVEVDADTVMVDELSLRDELDRLAAHYVNRKPLPPTTKQLQGIVSDAIGQIDALRETFGPQQIETMYAGDKEAAELRGLLDKLKANLQSADFAEAREAPEIVQRGQCMEMEWPKGGNARKLQNEYWTALALLWRRVVPQTTNKEVVTFVAIITGAKPETIRSYLYRRSSAIARCN
jgi:hypothetical protein